MEKTMTNKIESPLKTNGQPMEKHMEKPIKRLAMHGARLMLRALVWHLTGEDPDDVLHASFEAAGRTDDLYRSYVYDYRYSMSKTYMV